MNPQGWEGCRERRPPGRRGCCAPPLKDCVPRRSRAPAERYGRSVAREGHIRSDRQGCGHCDAHQGRTYELSGDTAWTFTDLAGEISRQSSTEVSYRSIAPAERLHALLQAGLPEAIADLLVDIGDAISRGLLADTPGDLSRLIGRPTTPVTETIANALKAL